MHLGWVVNGKSEQAFTGTALFVWCMFGLVVTGLIIWITEYYTGREYRPVRSVARLQSPVTAPTSSRALLSPWKQRRFLRLIIIAVSLSRSAGRLFGIAIAVTAMLGVGRYDRGA